MNNRIVVLGGGESGVGAAVLAKVKGFDVFLSDKGKIEDRYVKMLEQWEIPFEQGGHTEDLILNASEVIKSPGIPSTVPLVKKIEAAGIGIVSEIEFAGRIRCADSHENGDLPPRVRDDDIRSPAVPVRGFPQEERRYARDARCAGQR